MAADELTWTRLHWSGGLDEARVGALLHAVASDRRGHSVIFELRAEQDGLAHLMGCSATAVQHFKRLLSDQLLDIAFSAAGARTPLAEAGRLTVVPRAMALRTDNAVEVTRNLLSAMAVRLRSGEAQAIQVTLGRRHGPRLVAPDAKAPTRHWWQPLTTGEAPASSDERRSLRVKAEEASFDAIVRVGTLGQDERRTRRLSLALHSALATARAPGVRMEFVKENPARLHKGHLALRGIELACSELVGLLGWPLGDDDLPGLPPAHPRPLRPAAAVAVAERPVGRSAAPGDARTVGIAAKDAVYHGVTYGPSGSGKTTVMLHLIEADMKAGRPVAVLDPKMQLIESVLGLVPEDRIDDVVILDPADDPPVGFNPLDVAGRNPDVVVDGILSVFGALFADGWGARTADIFSATMRTLARSAAVSGRTATLADIPRILTDPAMRRSRMAELLYDEGLVSFWAWWDSQSPAAQAAAIASPLNKLRQLLLRPGLLRMLDQPESNFRLRDIWRDNKIVLVPLNEGLIGPGTAELIGSLVVADLWQSIQERATEKRPEARPGFVYLDEAPRFLHLPTSIADALAVSRSLGVGWLLAAQFSRQFPREVREAIDMNARSKVVFATEYEDARHFARGASKLDTEDFQALGRYQAYANLVAGGHPQGWALIETLPASPPTTGPKRVRARSRAQWAVTSPPESAQGSPAQPSGAGVEPTPALAVGRRPRRQL